MERLPVLQNALKCHAKSNIYMYLHFVNVRVYSLNEILEGRKVFQEVLTYISKFYQVVCAEYLPLLTPIPKLSISSPHFYLHGLLQSMNPLALWV